MSVSPRPVISSEPPIVEGDDGPVTSDSPMCRVGASKSGGSLSQRRGNALALSGSAQPLETSVSGSTSSLQIRRSVGSLQLSEEVFDATLAPAEDIQAHAREIVRLPPLSVSSQRTPTPTTTTSSSAFSATLQPHGGATFGPGIPKGFFATPTSQSALSGHHLDDDVPTEEHTVVVMTYNILADRYTSTDKYPHCALMTWALDPNYRLANILGEICDHDPSVLFLQELSMHWYHNGLGERLRQHGYTIDHVPIAPDPRVHKKQISIEDQAEGVAIAFKSARFQPLKRVALDFNQLCMQAVELPQETREMLCVASHNVALVYVLREVQTNHIYICATVHLFWDCSRVDRQLWQLNKLLECVSAEKAEAVALYCPDMPHNVTAVVGGDLNSEPSSLPIQFLSSGVCPIPPCSSSNNPIITQPLQHDLRLHSAYNDYFRVYRDHVTCVSAEWQGEIDYIFYEPTAGWSVGGTAGLEAAGAPTPPNKNAPSDHYPLVAHLTIQLPQLQQ